MTFNLRYTANPLTHIWANRRVRSFVFQAVTLLCVIWLGWSMAHNAAVTMAQQNIASGFGFLEQTAGFEIIMSLIPFDATSSYGMALAVSLVNTLIIAFVGIVFATVLGFSVGLARLSSNWLVRQLATIYVELLRNVPLLLQLFFWYFVVLRAVPRPRDSWTFLDAIFVNNRGLYLPRPLLEDGAGLVFGIAVLGLISAIIVARWARQRRLQTGQVFPILPINLALILGLPLFAFALMSAPVGFEYPALKGFNFAGGWVLIPEFVALTIALATYTAAFIAEIVRAGVLAVDKGQYEAAHALGLSPRSTLRLVIIPQAIRVIIPPLTSQFLNLTKNSSLAVAIAYPDLFSVFAGTVLMQTGQAVEVLLITMSVYLFLSLVTSGFMNWHNARVALVER